MKHEMRVEFVARASGEFPAGQTPLLYSSDGEAGISSSPSDVLYFCSGKKWIACRYFYAPGKTDGAGRSIKPLHNFFWRLL